jgi:hypothetical protein
MNKLKLNQLRKKIARNKYQKRLPIDKYIILTETCEYVKK